MTSNTQPHVTAEVHDDEHVYEIPSFDCTPWFEQADDQDILDLAACGWGGDYPADHVALFFEYDEDYPEIMEMFRYKRAGFECYVDSTSALTWLGVHRPHLVERVGMNIQGQPVFEMREGETAT